MLTLDGYDILDILAEGESKILLRARDSAHGRAVVIKLLREEHPSAAELTRLENEFAVAHDLPAAAVVRPLHVQRFGRRAGLVMCDTGGAPLPQVLSATPAPVEEALRLALSLAEAVGTLHEAGVVHRDIKPANVVVDGGACRLVDFELAVRLGGGALPVDGLQGTPAYVSPEQTGRMNRPVDARADLYSLGVTLYRIVTGRLPFEATDPLELVHCHLAVAPTPPAELDPVVPGVLSDLVLRLLAKAPEDRYQSAHGLVADLRERLRRWEATGGIEPFPLGSADVPGRFAVPEKLYGRDTELAELAAAVAESGGGGRLLVLVAGPAGVGKTALVNELGPDLAAHRCYAVSGKFDQFTRDIPYASLVEALDGLVRQLLGEPAERLAAWRARICRMLGENVGVMAEVLPDLRLVVGETPPVTALGPTETQNRFNLVFRSFIRLFGRPEHPLAIFLNDLHLADAASVKLLASLLRDSDLTHLLVIGAFRPTDVAPGTCWDTRWSGTGPGPSAASASASSTGPRHTHSSRSR